MSHQHCIWVSHSFEADWQIASVPHRIHVNRMVHKSSKSKVQFSHRKCGKSMTLCCISESMETCSQMLVTGQFDTILWQAVPSSLFSYSLTLLLTLHQDSLLASSHCLFRKMGIKQKHGLILVLQNSTAGLCNPTFHYFEARIFWKYISFTHLFIGIWCMPSCWANQKWARLWVISKGIPGYYGAIVAVLHL